MKAVLLPIFPRYCEKIASGKKTVEVRKTAPKIPTPFKCYIYETKTKRKGFLAEYDTAVITSDGNVVNGSQKVIGEFVCDRIDEYVNHFMAWRDKNGKQFNVGEFLSNACLTLDEASNYISGAIWFYGWHISNLKIYDKPKELGEFKRPWRNCGRFGSRFCKYFCDRMVDNDMFEGRCNQNDDYGNPINRPPQSWMYVEEI